MQIAYINFHNFLYDIRLVTLEMIPCRYIYTFLTNTFKVFKVAKTAAVK